MTILSIILLIIVLVPVIIIAYGAIVNTDAGIRLARDREAKGLDPTEKE